MNTHTKLTIGAAARQAGIPAKTIRFYEAQGIVPRPARTEAGYRLYAAEDVRRLRLIRRARGLGVPLPAVKQLAAEALAASCEDYGRQVLRLIAVQQAVIDQRIAALTALRAAFDDLAEQTRRCQDTTRPGQRVTECAACPLLDEEGGDCDA